MAPAVRIASGAIAAGHESQIFRLMKKLAKATRLARR